MGVLSAPHSYGALPLHWDKRKQQVNGILSGGQISVEIGCVPVATFIHNNVPLLLVGVVVNDALKEEVVRLACVICVVAVKAESHPFMELNVIQIQALLGPDLFEVVPPAGPRIGI